MPSKKLLEDFPLYRKLKTGKSLHSLETLPKVSINMSCAECDSDQTFNMSNNYWNGIGYNDRNLHGRVTTLIYTCTHCDKFKRHFTITAGGSPNDFWYQKVGQYPSWEIKGDPNIERLLGKHSAYFRRGLVSESQGYGIGAFAYYRRIVEVIIDELLGEISELLSGEELEKYNEALEKAKATRIAAEKIDIVKDLLPAILRPEGMNPLSGLHSTLSQGLHADSDESCMERAESCREILTFLVHQVTASKSAGKSFTENMRKLLEKKSQKKPITEG